MSSLDISSEAHAYNHGNYISSDFKCFPKLPIELQLEIWKLMCNVSRIVDVHPIYVKPLQHGTRFLSLIGYKSYCPPPPVLHVCRQSRACGLTHYEVSFATDNERFEWDMPNVFVLAPSDQRIFNNPASRGGIYINFNNDVLLPFFTKEQLPFNGTLILP